MARVLTAAVAALAVLSGGARAVANSPEQNARVEGDWRATWHAIRTESGDYSFHRGIPTTFKPKCGEGACDVILTFREWVGEVRMTLKRAGSRYSGRRTLVVGGYCNGHWRKGVITARFKVVLRVVGVADDGEANKMRGRYTAGPETLHRECGGGTGQGEIYKWTIKKSRRQH